MTPYNNYAILYRTIYDLISHINVAFAWGYTFIMLYALGVGNILII